MTPSPHQAPEQDPRRRRARFRAWHRGMRETDLILGGFADREIGGVPEAELAQFEALLEEADSDILSWLTANGTLPARHDTPLFARIRAWSRTMSRTEPQ